MHTAEIDYKTLVEDVLKLIAHVNTVWKKYRNMVVDHEDIGTKIKSSQDMKTNNSPVTQADIDIECYLKDELCALLPWSHFAWEETWFTWSGTNSEYTRRCDPIDKTRQMWRWQHNRWILIALKKDDKIVFWLSSMPAIWEILYAYIWWWARLNWQRVNVSQRNLHDHPMITHERIKYFEVMWADILHWLLKLWKDAYCTIDTLMTYHYLASWRSEGHITPPTHLYDIAPFLIIIAEAWWHITQMNGEPLDLSPWQRTSAIFSNGVCHDELVSYFT